MIATKNYQSEAVIREMAARAFPERELAEIREMTEGMCNVTYRLTAVRPSLRSAQSMPTLRNEKNMMQVEIRALRLLAAHPEIDAPKLHAADNSKTLCSGRIS